MFVTMFCFKGNVISGSHTWVEPGTLHSSIQTGPHSTKLITHYLSQKGSKKLVRESDKYLKLKLQLDSGIRRFFSIIWNQNKCCCLAHGKTVHDTKQEITHTKCFSINSLFITQIYRKIRCTIFSFVE